MRPIKFRAWNKISKVMGYVHNIDFAEEDVKVMVDNPNITKETGLSFDFRYWNFDAIELMQFTGLYDKNGKEIYEGDIVKGKFIRYLPEKKIFKIISAVIFEHGMFRIKCRYSKWSKKFYYDSFPYSHGKGEYLKIIGNIFENPKQEGGK